MHEVKHKLQTDLDELQLKMRKLDADSSKAIILRSETLPFNYMLWISLNQFLTFLTNILSSFYVAVGDNLTCLLFILFIHIKISDIGTFKIYISQ